MGFIRSQSDARMVVALLARIRRSSRASGGKTSYAPASRFAGDKALALKEVDLVLVPIPDCRDVQR